MTKLIATTLSRHHCHVFEHVHNEQKLDLALVLVLVLVLVLKSKAHYCITHAAGEQPAASSIYVFYTKA